MAYEAFIQVITQLAGQKQARIVVKDQVIFIDQRENPSLKNIWKLTAKVFDGDGHLPPAIRDCVSSVGILRWEESGAELRVDPRTQSVYLTHEIDAASRYIPFRYQITDFANLAKEWSAYFGDLVTK